MQREQKCRLIPGRDVACTASNLHQARPMCARVRGHAIIRLFPLHLIARWHRRPEGVVAPPQAAIWCTGMDDDDLRLRVAGVCVRWRRRCRWALVGHSYICYGPAISPDAVSAPPVVFEGPNPSAPPSGRAGGCRRAQVKTFFTAPPPLRAIKRWCEDPTRTVIAMTSSPEALYRLQATVRPRDTIHWAQSHLNILIDTVAKP